MSKPGRNDPCYCGSGKKYKQCHLKEDQAKEQNQRAMQEAVRYVRRDLLKFARDEQFAADFAQALPRYWNELYTVDNAEDMSQEEALRFFDWFTYDYTLANGRSLIDIYDETRREYLSTPQQQVLDDWKTAVPASAYEMTDCDGQTLHLRDFFTGEAFTVYEPTGRGNVEIGEVILTRLVPVLDQIEFSTAAAYLPHDEIDGLQQTMDKAKEAYLAEHPDASHEQFLRHNNHLIVHHALVQAENQGRHPVARLNPDRPDKKTQKIVQKMKRLKR